MDIETKKIKSPYKPSSDYFSDLAMKIQQKAGIEPLDLGIKEEIVSFKSAAKEPIQLTVEFGFPLTTQRSSEPDISMPEAPLPAVENIPVAEKLPGEENHSVVEKLPEVENVPVSEKLQTEVTLAKDQRPKTKDQEPTTELEFSDEDLDRLHAEMTGESIVPVQATFERESAPVKMEQPKASKVEKSTSKNTQERVSIWAMIPWSSLLGVAASLFAVAAAWLVWNQIQKPMTVEQRVARAVQTAPVAAAAVKTSPEKKELNIEALPASHQVIYDMIQEGTSADKHVMNFNQMPEQSRISSVELERNGLTVLDLEDQIFDEIEL
ncbi:MAG: hypothetical protein NBV77_00090 [Bacteroidia bacterium]|nr:hypothetical protein [Bacteroidia bacterium]